MLFGNVRWLLVVIMCLFWACWFVVVHCFLFVMCCLSVVVCCLLFVVVRCLLVVVCRS